MVLICRRCLLWCGIGRLSYRGCLGVDVKAGDCFPNISFVQVIARVRMVFLCLRLVFCRHSRAHSSHQLSWNDIVEHAKAAEPFRTILDPDYGEFFAGGDMVRKIQEYARQTNQPVPETVGQVARAIYESLALKYRWALERLQGRRFATALPSMWMGKPIMKVRQRLWR